MAGINQPNELTIGADQNGFSISGELQSKVAKGPLLFTRLSNNNMVCMVCELGPVAKKILWDRREQLDGQTNT